MTPSNLHATALRIGPWGVLIRGASGAGKSSLALSLLRRAAAEGLEARLVCDDQVFLRCESNRLLAVAPETIQGLIEVRGVGILSLPFTPHAAIHLLVDLMTAEQIPRLPEDGFETLEGTRLRRIGLPVQASAWSADAVMTLLGTWRP